METFRDGPGEAADAPRARERDEALAVRVVEHLGVPAFVLGADGCVLLWNKACEDLTGAPAREMLGAPNPWRAFYDAPRPCLADLVLSRRVDVVGSLYLRGGASPRGGRALSAEAWCAMPHLGRPLYLAIDAAPIYDRSGSLVAVVETLRDLTADKRRQEELESLASLDGLTGLLNRRSFDERLATEARRASRERFSLALLMIDVDDFKPYNDAHGHLIGDACLRNVAAAIRGALSRAGDVAARYGGDEFAVILPGTLDKVGAEVAGRVVASVAETTSAIGVDITASAGVAAVRTGVASREDLVEAADTALYRAKAAGGDGVAIHDRGARRGGLRVGETRMHSA